MHACDMSIRHADYETCMRDGGSARVTVFLAYLVVGYLAMPMVSMRKILYIMCGGGGYIIAGKNNGLPNFTPHRPFFRDPLIHHCFHERDIS